jgi:citrate lyase subunit gamma (acyl carrier protein)
MIETIAQAGTLESSDCLVTVSPSPTLDLECRGATAGLFAERNRAVVESVLRERGLTGAKAPRPEPGARERPRRARSGTALDRARGGAR